jgi:DNA methylase/ParB-like nuclease domain
MAIVIRRNPTASALTEAEARQLHEQISNLTIEVVPIESVKPNPRNAKRHPRRQIGLIAENIEKLGFHHPLLVDEEGMLLSGHARLLAAHLLNLEKIPVLRLRNLSPQQKRAVALADNKLAELGQWDREMLRLELKELTADVPKLEFDYTITGFETGEIDQILVGELSPSRPDPIDNLPRVPDDEVAVTQAGDLWICADHRLFCGDALDAFSFAALLGGEFADLVFALPNLSGVRPDGRPRTLKELGTVAAPPRSSEERIDFLTTISAHIARNVTPGAVLFFWVDWRHFEELAAANRAYFGTPKDLVVICNPDAEPGTFYRSQHEQIMVYVAGDAPGAKPPLHGRGRHRSNLWSGYRMSGRHPMQKPVALLVDAIRDCSKRGDTVLDPFAGFGTTMIAAERAGRRARLIESDPLFCDLIVRRWQEHSGKTAQLAESNETFAELERRRGADGARR